MRQVHVRFTGFTCDVRIGPNLLPTLGRQAKAASRSPRAALVTDEHVAAHYLDPALDSLRGAGLEAEAVVVAPGEASKTLAEAGRLYDRMLLARLDRGSVVVALGGGVVTDLAGFVAATYMRGIAWVGVSTSLLGQVDASVGGKTGVDHPACKNLIGAFHQPSAVLADVGTLRTLPDEELRTGLAEVVMADEREGGLRRILNYGHTVGHALESLALRPCAAVPSIPSSSPSALTKPR